jgi:predicted O-methyltransferase YrrM
VGEEPPRTGRPRAEAAHPPGLRARLRSLTLGLATVCGVRRSGYYAPLRHAEALPKPGASPPYDAVARVMAARHAAFARQIAEIERWAPALEAIGRAPAPAPRWRQDWFPRLDAATAYAMVRSRAPARIVEIGSGHSTRFMARAAADGGLATRIVAVDPAPRAALPPSVEHLGVPVHRAPAAAFAALGPGDILFVDSSHVLVPGSDVDFVLNRLWPALPSGALVHFHDIFLPDDYPAAWAWRGYNEQLGVAPLVASGAAEIAFASRYVLTRLADALAGTVVERLPIVPGAIESSLWLEKVAGA